MTRRFRAAAAALLATVGIASVGTGSDQPRPRDPEWVAPSSSASKVNPLATRREAAAGGQKLYRQRCSSCHGAEGGGTDRAPSLIAAEVQAQSEGALFWKITSGNSRSGMPSFSFLPELQRWQLVLHVRALANPERGGNPRLVIEERGGNPRLVISDLQRR